ncbi:hypothetical protein [Rhodanobacter sp. DHG33]|uniref:hypothetical protein n=1 Tax=Rhodanobacter sp. DHG33 TaxID=2775921 RepID=UPI0017839105|nr:hypothetical protein [Rhodanobacter sp. DHG33]MBD8898983.1 hypothetical protein [Rhodanobacter sp. DHG33]
MKRLYHDYSWEAVMIAGPDPWIGDAPKATLDHYFNGDLVAIWLKSRKCGGDCAVGWIGYDPLWDSMDPSGFSDVSVWGTDDPHIVKVEMTGPCVPGKACKPEGSGRVRLIYFLRPTALGWRISDIRSEVHGSLKAALLKVSSEH